MLIAKQNKTKTKKREGGKNKEKMPIGNKEKNTKIVTGNILWNFLPLFFPGM